MGEWVGSVKSLFWIIGFFLFAKPLIGNVSYYMSKLIICVSRLAVCLLSSKSMADNAWLGLNYDWLTETGPVPDSTG